MFGRVAGLSGLPTELRLFGLYEAKLDYRVPPLAQPPGDDDGSGTP
jgi:hypothetical protein